MKKPSRVTRKGIDIGKRQCQLFHVKKRARERLGIYLTKEKIEQIISVIKKNKETDEFSVKFIKNQSNRLELYEMKIKNKDIVNVVYDSSRSSIVTFLFPDEQEIIYNYYDIFNNKISTKHEFGKVWTLYCDKLEIPGETVIYKDGVWYVEEGTLKGKKFKKEDEHLVEIM